MVAFQIEDHFFFGDRPKREDIAPQIFACPPNIPFWLRAWVLSLQISGYAPDCFYLYTIYW